MKDRAAARMIADGEASGRLTPGLTIVDATSGNTGIAYAMVGAARGYKVKLCLPENASPERKLILRAFGAELVLTNPLEGTDGAIREVRRMVAEDPDRYFYPDQYSNDAQLARAFRYDRPRNHRADRRAPHAFRRRARHQRDVRRHRPAAAAVQPGDQADFVSARLAVSRPRRVEAHGVGDGAGDLRRRRSPTRIFGVEHRRGAPAGAPAGARRRTDGRHFVRRRAGRDARRRARDSTQGVVVTVFPDGAEKYLSEKFWTADD